MVWRNKLSIHYLNTNSKMNSYIYFYVNFYIKWYLTKVKYPCIIKIENEKPQTWFTSKYV